MTDDVIYKLVSFEAAKSILSTYSTFVLNSHRKYIYMECGREDDEVLKEFKNIRIETVNNVFISCWSLKKDNSPIDWNLYKNTYEGIVIYSTINKVKSFLEIVGEYLNASYIDGKEVKYITPNERPNNNELGIFCKYNIPRFRKENEFRFVLQNNNTSEMVSDTSSIVLNIPDPSIYIDSVLISPFCKSRDILINGYNNLNSELIYQNKKLRFDLQY